LGKYVAIKVENTFHFYGKENAIFVATFREDSFLHNSDLEFNWSGKMRYRMRKAHITGCAGDWNSSC
jgi:hypothetical protein